MIFHKMVQIRYPYVIDDIWYKLLGILCNIGMSKLVTYWLWNMAGDPAEQIQILFDKIHLERHLYKTAIEYDKIMPQ